MKLQARQLVDRAIRLGTRVPGVAPVVRAMRRRSLGIVMYHGVVAERLPVENWCHLDVGQFAAHLAFLSAHYTILPLKEAVERLRDEKPLPRAPVALTFDDGFRSVLTTALPVLEKHGAPATVFLVTGGIGSRQPAWPDRLFHALVTTRRNHVELGKFSWELRNEEQRAGAYRSLVGVLKNLDLADKDAALAELLAALGASPVPAESPLAILDWREIDQLARTGLIDFGSHTCTHPILSRCSEAVQEEELRASRDVLRERLGRCDLFAYPNGTRADFTSATMALVARLGYQCALSTEPGLNRRGEDVFALRRVNVGAGTDASQFERLMLG